MGIAIHRPTGAAIGWWIPLAAGQTRITMILAKMIVTNTLQEDFPGITTFAIGGNPQNHAGP